MFQGRITIPVTSGTQNIRYEALIGTTADRVRLVKKLRGEGRTKGEITLLTGLSERMVKKYFDMRNVISPTRSRPSEAVSTKKR